MALQLTHEFATGVSGDYWKVSSISIDRLYDTIGVVILLYKDAASRTDGKEYMLSRSYQFSGIDLAALETATTTGTNPVELAYNKLKTLDEFSTATDV